MSLRDALAATARLQQLREDRDSYLRRQRLGLIERDDAWLDHLDTTIAQLERQAQTALTDPRAGADEASSTGIRNT